eukprot:2389784-Karenia_brevis.AAC.1
MPRTLAVYERKTRWRSYDEEWDGAAVSKANYKSVTDCGDAVEALFLEDVALGHMREEDEDV